MSQHVHAEGCCAAINQLRTTFECLDSRKKAVTPGTVRTSKVISPTSECLSRVAEMRSSLVRRTFQSCKAVRWCPPCVARIALPSREYFLRSVGRRDALTISGDTRRGLQRGRSMSSLVKCRLQASKACDEPLRLVWGCLRRMMSGQARSTPIEGYSILCCIDFATLVACQDELAAFYHTSRLWASKTLLLQPKQPRRASPPISHGRRERLCAAD